MAAEVKVGDIIKALDFPGRDNTYMIGKVTKLEGEYIYCTGISRSWDGRAESCDNFRTVVEGANFMDKHFPGRITVIA